MASLSEDFLAFGGLWAALHYPLLFLFFLVVFVVLAIWMLPRIWRGLKRVGQWLRRRLGGGSDDPEAPLRSTPLP